MLALTWIGSYGREYRITAPADEAQRLLAILSSSGLAAWISRP
jgi:hypothetical protein